MGKHHLHNIEENKSKASLSEHLGSESSRNVLKRADSTDVSITFPFLFKIGVFRSTLSWLFPPVISQIIIKLTYNTLVI